MKVKLIRQFNKGKRIFRDRVEPLDDVEIDLDKMGNAVAIQGDRIIDRIERARVETISLDGLTIAGLEGHFVNGAQMYYYQEWWCVTRIYII